MNQAGQETVLYNFGSQPKNADGVDDSGLLLDSAGNLFGTTDAGGAKGAGTVFKLGAGGGGGTATVALTSNQNPSTVGQSVTFTAVVSGSGATPTGTVTFLSGTATLGVVTLSGGTAKLTTAFTTAGVFPSSPNTPVTATTRPQIPVRSPKS